jgi:hypothetical protein
MNLRIKIDILSFLLLGLLSCFDNIKVDLQISNDSKLPY